MLIELLKQETPELARRWLAALMIVPEDERAEVVESVEQRLVEVYADQRNPDDQPILSYTTPPTQHEGYTETVTRDYANAEGEASESEDRRDQPPKRKAT